MTEQSNPKRYRHYTYFSGGQTSVQFACFQCRKVFKHKVSFRGEEDEKQICPQCGLKLWLAGTAFKAPRKENGKQWHKAEALIKSGILFYPHAGYRPKTLQEVMPFLRKHLLKSAGEDLLSKLSKTKNKKPSRA